MLPRGWTRRLRSGFEPCAIPRARRECLTIVTMERRASKTRLNPAGVWRRAVCAANGWPRTIRPRADPDLPGPAGVRICVRKPAHRRRDTERIHRSRRAGTQRDCDRRRSNRQPCRNVRVELVDGSYHDVDSSETAFRFAAAIAFQDAVKNAGPIVDMFDDDLESFVTEPRHPVPTPRDSAISLPEPDDFTEDDSDLNR